MTTVENWRPVVGWEGLYEVSDLGRVRSLPRSNRWPGQILNPTLNTGGYPIVGLRDGSRRTSKPVHRLVGEAFLGALPDDLLTRHLDGNKANAVLANLIYGTVAENEHDKIRHGTNYNANRTHCPADHPYDEANTYRARGRRYCRACN